MRATIRHQPDGLEVSMPVRRYYVVMAFLTVWLVGWAMGEGLAVVGLLNGRAPIGDVVFDVWLLLWTMAGACVVGVCLLMLVGREVLVLREDGLILRRQLWGLGRVRKFDRHRLGKFRLQRKALSWTDHSVRRFWNGPIAFNSGLETVHVGNGVNDDEARAIIDELNKRV